MKKAPAPLNKFGRLVVSSGLPYAAWALRLGVANASVVHRYATGMRTPRPRIMARITRETEGAITANDFQGEAA